MTPEYTLEDCGTEYGWLEVGGVAMTCPAWGLPDLSPLYGPPARRGSDRLLPGVPGVRPYPRRRTVTAYSLLLLVTGQVDRAGDAHPDPFHGLAVNMSWLNANVLLPVESGDGTREVVFHAPDGTTREADAHVDLGTRLLRPKGLLRTTLELSFPRGDLYL